MSIATATDKQKINSLHRLLIHQAPEKVIVQLTAAIDKSSIDKDKESILSSAIYTPSYIQILVDAGYSVNHKNEFGKTPLYYAIQSNHHDSASLLLSNGANVNSTYQQNEKDPWPCLAIERWGRTPLMHAAQHADSKMLALLLANGANLHATDVKGSNALDYATQNKKQENVDFLILEMHKTSPIKAIKEN